MIPASQRHAGALAALVHRLSGIALAIFLPCHFLVLGLALESEAKLDGALAWTDQPLVKVTEIALVALLALHASLGIRVLVLEWLPWRGLRKDWIAVAVALSLAAGTLALVRVV